MKVTLFGDSGSPWTPSTEKGIFPTRGGGQRRRRRRNCSVSRGTRSYTCFVVSISTKGGKRGGTRDAGNLIESPGKRAPRPGESQPSAGVPARIELHRELVRRGAREYSGAATTRRNWQTESSGQRRCSSPKISPCGRRLFTKTAW